MDDLAGAQQAQRLLSRSLSMRYAGKGCMHAPGHLICAAHLVCEVALHILLLLQCLVRHQVPALAVADLVRRALVHHAGVVQVRQVGHGRHVRVAAGRCDANERSRYGAMSCESGGREARCAHRSPDTAMPVNWLRCAPGQSQCPPPHTHTSKRLAPASSSAAQAAPGVRRTHVGSCRWR